MYKAAIIALAASLISGCTDEKAPPETVPAAWQTWTADRTTYLTDGPTAVLRLTDYSYLPAQGSVFFNAEAAGRVVLAATRKPATLAEVSYQPPEMVWQGEDSRTSYAVADGLPSVDVTARFSAKFNIEHLDLDTTQLRVLLFDAEAELPASYKGLSFFPHDQAGVVGAEFLPAETLEPVILDTERGLTKRFYLAGHFAFEFGGAQIRMPAYTMSADPAAIDYMLLGFRDTTNGRTSYGVGRYLDVTGFGPFPPAGARLDFNYAYNPTCAYSGAYNCPIIPFGFDGDVPYGESYEG